MSQEKQTLKFTTIQAEANAKVHIAEVSKTQHYIIVEHGSDSMEYMVFQNQGMELKYAKIGDFEVGESIHSQGRVIDNPNISETKK